MGYLSYLTVVYLYYPAVPVQLSDRGDDRGGAGAEHLVKLSGVGGFVYLVDGYFPLGHLVAVAFEIFYGGRSRNARKNAAFE